MNTKKFDSYKRIHFQLPLSLAREFELAAKKEGVTKAKLLRRWTKVSDVTSVLSRSWESPVNFNFRISDKEQKLLDEKAQACGTTTSGYLRQVVQSNLFQTSYEKPLRQEANFESLAKKGKIKEASQQINFDKISDKRHELYTAADVYIKMGELDKAESIANHLTDFEVATKQESDRHNANINLIKGRVASYRRENEKSYPLINNALIFATMAHDKALIGSSHYYLGVLGMMTDKNAQALRELTSALEVYNVDSDPVEVASIYMRLASTLICEGNKDLSDMYTERAQAIVDKLDNDFMKAWVANKKGIVDYNKNNLVAVKSDIDSVSNSSLLISSSMENHYFLDNMARYNLAKGNFAAAHTLFTRAEDADMMFRPKGKFSYSKLFKVLIEAKEDYSKSISKMDNIISDAGTAFRPNLTNYLYSSTQYLFGSGVDKSKGEKKLKEMAISPKSSTFYKEMAVNTLVKKQLQPVR